MYFFKKEAKSIISPLFIIYYTINLFPFTLCSQPISLASQPKLTENERFLVTLGIR